MFIRNGKRVVAVSEPGKQVLRIAERILREAKTSSAWGEEFASEAEGSLIIATTHTQARYALPETIRAFRQHYPNVRLQLKQGNPTQICDMVVAGEADFAIATEGILLYKELAALPCHSWNRSVVAPHGHPLTELDRPITLADIGAYPIITYDTAFTGRTRINHAFEQAGSPQSGADRHRHRRDQNLCRHWLGVGIIASMGYEPDRDRDLGGAGRQPSVRAVHHQDRHPQRCLPARLCLYLLLNCLPLHLTRAKVDEAILAGQQP